MIYINLPSRGSSFLTQFFVNCIILSIFVVVPSIKDTSVKSNPVYAVNTSLKVPIKKHVSRWCSVSDCIGTGQKFTVLTQINTKVAEWLVMCAAVSGYSSHKVLNWPSTNTTSKCFHLLNHMWVWIHSLVSVSRKVIKSTILIHVILIQEFGSRNSFLLIMDIWLELIGVKCRFKRTSQCAICWMSNSVQCYYWM